MLALATAARVATVGAESIKVWKYDQIDFSPSPGRDAGTCSLWTIGSFLSTDCRCRWSGKFLAFWNWTLAQTDITGACGSQSAHPKICLLLIYLIIKSFNHILNFINSVENSNVSSVLSSSTLTFTYLRRFWICNSILFYEEALDKSVPLRPRAIHGAPRITGHARARHSSCPQRVTALTSGLTQPATKISTWPFLSI